MCALCVVLQAVYKVVEHATVKLPVLERVKENDTGDVMMSDMAMSPDVSTLRHTIVRQSLQNSHICMRLFPGRLGGLWADRRR